MQILSEFFNQITLVFDSRLTIFSTSQHSMLREWFSMYYPPQPHLLHNVSLSQDARKGLLVPLACTFQGRSHHSSERLPSDVTNVGNNEGSKTSMLAHLALANGVWRERERDSRGFGFSQYRKPTGGQSSKAEDAPPPSTQWNLALHLANPLSQSNEEIKLGYSMFSEQLPFASCHVTPVASFLSSETPFPTSAG